MRGGAGAELCTADGGLRGKERVLFNSSVCHWSCLPSETGVSVWDVLWSGCD